MLALYLKERWLVLMERLSTEALEAIEKRAGDCIKCDACAVIPYTCETPVKQEEIQFVAREFLKYIHGGTYDESKFNR
jgi:Na+-translocating ferredoxin:NAD+ oxidoreductase RnfC subunit